MCGLSSLEYFTGLLAADMVIFMIPNVVISAILPIFPQIMVPSQIGWFFFAFTLFGLASLNLVYLVSQMVDNPTTGAKLIPVMFILLFFLTPIIFAFIISGIVQSDPYMKSVTNTISPFYFFDSILTFGVELWFICVKDKPDMEDWTFKLFRTLEPTHGMYIGVILAQSVGFFIINVLVDSRVMYGYKRRSSHIGAEPPMLDVEQDVRDHE